MKNKIRFLPQNVEMEVSPEKSVMELAHENGIFIQSSCKGVATCGECRVLVKEGENQVLPPTSKELALIGQGHYIDRRRLSCQLYCYGNITVDLTEQVEKSQDQKMSKVFLQKIKKDADDTIHSVRDNLIEQDQDMKKS